MKLVNITRKDLFDDFMSTQSHAQFLQSWQWGEFQEKTVGRIIRVGVEEGGELMAAASLVKTPLIAGYNYYYCPRGPVIDDLGFMILDFGINSEIKEENNKQIINKLFDEIRVLAKSEKAIFLRFEPKYKIINHKSEIINSIDVQPSKTLVLNLTNTEEELLMAMHQKTRYNIRLAEKKGVKIIEAGKENFDDFWSLMQETKERDGFRLHSRNYYQKMFGLPFDFLKIFLAEFNGQIIAAAIVSFFGDTATYVHGASGDTDRNVMAPFLLQWQAIKLAKQRGLKYYDFHGIDEKKWSGVTRFKLGFGGQEINYPGTFDLVFNKTWYNAYKVLRKIRRSI